MSDDRDNFFDTVFNKDDFFTRQLMYENRVVRRAIAECGIKPRSWGRLVNMCRDETGQPFFSCDWFNHFFPSFPARLCAKRIGYCGTRVEGGERKKVCLYQLTLKDILRPEKNLLVGAVSNALGELNVNTSDPFVLVFPIVKKMFCAHNLSLDTYESDIRAQWVFQHGRKPLIVEPSVTLFGAIGNGWYQE